MDQTKGILYKLVPDLPLPLKKRIVIKTEQVEADDGDVGLREHLDQQFEVGELRQDSLDGRFSQEVIKEEVLKQEVCNTGYGSYMEMIEAQARMMPWPHEESSGPDFVSLASSAPNLPPWDLEPDWVIEDTPALEHQGLVPYWAAEDKTRVFDSFAVESPAVPTMYSEMIKEEEDSPEEKNIIEEISEDLKPDWVAEDGTEAMDPFAEEGPAAPVFYSDEMKGEGEENELQDFNEENLEDLKPDWVAGDVTEVLDPLAAEGPAVPVMYSDEVKLEVGEVIENLDVNPNILEDLKPDWVAGDVTEVLDPLAAEGPAVPVMYSDEVKLEVGEVIENLDVNPNILEGPAEAIKKSNCSRVKRTFFSKRLLLRRKAVKILTKEKKAPLLCLSKTWVDLQIPLILKKHAIQMKIWKKKLNYWVRKLDKIKKNLK